MDPAPGQPPHQPGIHGPESKPAFLRGGPGARDIVQNPANLAGREIGIKGEAAPGLDLLLVAALLQPVAQVGSPLALPDHGIIKRFSRGPIPDHGGLPLIGDGKGADSPLVGPQRCRGLFHRGHGVGIQLLGIVLHPARLGVVLPVLDAAVGHHGCGGIQDKSLGCGRALIDGNDEGHAARILHDARPRLSGGNGSPTSDTW